jgi:hypothetical protein
VSAATNSGATAFLFPKRMSVLPRILLAKNMEIEATYGYEMYLLDHTSAIRVSSDLGQDPLQTRPRQIEKPWTG